MNALSPREPTLPLIALLATALVAAGWSQGDVMDRDRARVARLIRGGIQRLDADADHGVHTTAEAPIAAAPLVHPPDLGVTTAAWSPAFGALLAAAPALTLPAASPLGGHGSSSASRPLPPVRLARARAPPAA